jgi:hypothetical protein
MPEVSSLDGFPDGSLKCGLDIAMMGRRDIFSRFSNSSFKAFVGLTEVGLIMRDDGRGFETLVTEGTNSVSSAV